MEPTFFVGQLRCEASVNPLAIVTNHPRLSWVLESSMRGQCQSAYQILAASSPELLARDHGDFWDSGKVCSDETFNIPYQGKLLRSASRCWWKVRVWDIRGVVSEWSAEAMFGKGLEDSEWRAQWVGLDKGRSIEQPPAPFEGAQWIWLNKRETQNCGIFAGVLELPEGIEVETSTLAISVAGRYSFYWLEEQFGMSDGDPEPWRRPYIRHMNERLHAGKNLFVIKAEQINEEPAGVLFKLSVRARDGREFSLLSGETWHATSEIKPEWYACSNEWEAWPACLIVANYGELPWGILHGSERFLPPPARVRGTFAITRPVRQATFFATAFGWYDLRLNGQRVNENYFDPGWTDYTRRLYYRGYDATKYVNIGENAAAATVADGWFSGRIGWCNQRDIYGKHPRFLGQLHVLYADGSEEIFGTSPEWKGSLGPIKEADILMGETYDAREEQAGWDCADFDDSNWKPVDTGAELQPVLQPHPAPPVVALLAEQFIPREITKPAPGVYIFDLGQNFAGVVRLKLRDTRSGQKIVLRHGERLNADGTLYRVNLRTAQATDTYICKGAAEETWTPRFTFHGFQYVEVTGLSGQPSTETVTGIPLSSDTPVVGDFSTSNEQVNRLACNVYWGQRSNFIEIPTDCPQRDERLGWLDGAWTFLGAAALRADVQKFFTKFAIDMDDAQLSDGQFSWVAPRVVATIEHAGAMWASSSPAWSDAGVICPWRIYEIYGDLRQLERSYPSMVRLVQWYLETSSPDYLPPEQFKCLGDWLNHHAETPLDVFRTAFFAYSSGLVAQSARVLGKTADAEYYEKIHKAVKAAFRKAYVAEDGRIKGDAQGCYALALEFDLLEEPLARLAGLRLAERICQDGYLPSTGLEATLPLMRSLTKIGRTDFAYRLLHNDQFPSWNFSIKNGATTIWERWNSWTPEEGFGDANMNSFNHFSLGAIYQWMVETIGGIRNGGDAYRRIVISPVPGGKITSAHASYNSVRGLIESRWSLSNGMLRLFVRIPPNTKARIILPVRWLENIEEGGKPLDENGSVQFEETGEYGVTLTAGSGCYEFQIKDPILAT